MHLDFIGWFEIGVLVVLIGVAWAGGHVVERRRLRQLRAWASTAGWSELAPTATAPDVRRNTTFPLLHRTLGGREVVLFRTRTTPRGGPLWVLSTTVPGLAPGSVQSRVAFTAARTIGLARPARDWTRTETGERRFDARFYVDLPAGASVTSALPAPLRIVLSNETHLYSFVVREDHRAFLFVQSWRGSEVERALASGVATLEALLACHDRANEPSLRGRDKSDG